jgi:hypothetical protein
MICTKHYEAPPISHKEILRYMGCKEADSETLALIDSVLAEALPVLRYRVCFCEMPLTQTESGLCIGERSVPGKDLARCLSGCSRVLLFAATLGVELDRLIARYSARKPSRALVLQALGAERVESLCNAFIKDLKSEYGESGRSMRPRYSPGYGDLPLEFQKELFALLNCSKHIGLSLNESLLMSPSKSVTAVVGLFDEDQRSCL